MNKPFDYHNSDHVLAMYFLTQNEDLAAESIQQLTKVIDALVMIDLDFDGIDPLSATKSIMACLLTLLLEKFDKPNTDRPMPNYIDLDDSKQVDTFYWVANNSKSESVFNPLLDYMDIWKEENNMKSITPFLNVLSEIAHAHFNPIDESDNE